MRKYKVGDKVRIRSDLKCGDWGTCFANTSMAKHGGKVVTVASIVECFDNRFRIKESLHECDPLWHWSDEMVEPVEITMEDKKVFTKNDLKNGDVIKRANGNVSIFIENLGVFVSTSGWMPLNKVCDDLTHTRHDRGWDIVQVRRPIAPYNCQFSAFDTNMGELVYDRERDTKKPLYNGKVVCVDNHGSNSSLYTVGKIYQFVDGSFVADDGTETKNYYHPFESFKEWQEFSSSKWIEIKE
jgi:hypothetical protein